MRTITGSVVVAVLVAAVLTGADLGGRTATIFASSAILTFGLPHGTFDIELIRRDRSVRGTGLMILLALYLACALAMFLLWQVRPVLALMAFLVIATSHFAEDWEADSKLLATGIAAATLTAPVILHRAATAAIFEAVGGTANTAVVVEWMMLAAPVAMLFALVGVASLFRDGNRERALAAAATLAAMTLLPPVAGFALFFCAFHSPRHFSAALRSLGWLRPVQWFPVVTPLTLAAGGITALLYRFGAPIDVSSRLAASVFLALSILTVPHMAVPLIAKLFAARRPAV